MHEKQNANRIFFIKRGQKSFLKRPTEREIETEPAGGGKKVFGARERETFELLLRWIMISGRGNFSLGFCFVGLTYSVGWSL